MCRMTAKQLRWDAVALMLQLAGWCAWAASCCVLLLPCSPHLMSVVLIGLWRSCCLPSALCQNKHPCCVL